MLHVYVVVTKIVHISQCNTTTMPTELLCNRQINVLPLYETVLDSFINTHTTHIYKTNTVQELEPSSGVIKREQLSLDLMWQNSVCESCLAL